VEVYGRLLERIRALPVIDGHEHLPAESVLNTELVSALTLYRQYTRLPMFASGLSQEDFQRIHDPAVPVRKRWGMLKPYVARIKHTSVARAAQITLQHFWKATELTDDNVEAISEAMSEENKPGIYRRVLAEHCGIRAALNQDSTQGGIPEPDAGGAQALLAPVVSLIDVQPPENAYVNRLGGGDGFDTLDLYLDWACARLVSLAAEGAVAFKTTAMAYAKPDRKSALDEFEALRQQGWPLAVRSGPGPLLSYVHDELLAAAASVGLPVAVHTGVLGDFRRLNPTHMIPIIERHADVHFDLFHLGIPYVRQTCLMALNAPNVSVNMCWAHSLNASMARSALDEHADQLGADKIIGFGGDVRWCVHKVYGHLELARRNIAAVLAKRVEDALMDVDEALVLARSWLFDNPARIYGLTRG